ncbi:MAG: hypothetical protein LBJ25_08100 [Candidatus Margulisbacteria bacterium]|nr:hypothetical protein [Candidatus Margulisiibacteriota bacterium]
MTEAIAICKRHQPNIFLEIYPAEYIGCAVFFNSSMTVSERKITQSFNFPQAIFVKNLLFDPIDFMF